VRIISGGQTGVDRGALDAALDTGCDCGGWCPSGRRAEDGPIPARYPVRELSSNAYRERTLRNVLDSDGTLIIHFGELRGGTRLTRTLCRQYGRPCLAVEGGAGQTSAIAQRIAAFCRRHRIDTLNVAGPRESQATGATQHARLLVAALLARLRSEEDSQSSCRAAKFAAQSGSGSPSTR
jgi:predicted Rossmann fold nucleotide-binding protein DprA/Smf involved in DNA uptake